MNVYLSSVISTEYCTAILSETLFRTQCVVFMSAPHEGKAGTISWPDVFKATKPGSVCCPFHP